MTTADTLRPAVAAARFGVCERTLARWARAGLIGRSEIGRNVWYPAQDIADLIASHSERRTIVPFKEQPAPVGSDWRSDPLWSKAAAPTATPATRGGIGS